MAHEPVTVRLATRRGAGGVAVVVIAGTDRWQLLAGCLGDLGGCSRGGSSVRRDRPSRAVLFGRDGVIDDVLVVDRPEHGCTEIHAHASDAVLGELEAVFGGVADVAPADAWDRLLRDAASAPQLALALEQLALGGEAASRRAFEAAELDATARDVLRARSIVAAALCRPHTVVLVGRRNAGKSTLFNSLLGHERALTSEFPGATRDPVDALVFLDGYPCRLVDTAGEGSPADVLEAMAQRRAELVATKDCTIVRVVDASRARGEGDLAGIERAHIVVCNKHDLGVHVDWRSVPMAALRVSASSREGRGRLLNEFGTRLRTLRGLPPVPVSGVGGLACPSWRDPEDPASD
ncbi:MAG: GTPase [Planctomycetota bacterium]